MTKKNLTSILIYHNPDMPVKKTKKKKSGKKSAKKGLKGLQSIAEVLKSLRQQYETKSKDSNSYPHPDVKKLINQYADNNSLLVKVGMFLLK